MTASFALGCGVEQVGSPAMAHDPAYAPPTTRDELLKSVFGALAAGDPAWLISLGDPEVEWKATLECPPPLSSLREQRDEMATLIEKTKGLHVELVDVVEDRLLLDLPKGYDDGFGCTTRVAFMDHRLVLGLRVMTSTGATRPGKWTLQIIQHDGIWHLTSDVWRLNLGTETP